MHAEILTAEQQKFIPLIESFKKEYYWVGDVAIALYLGHRSVEVLEFGKHHDLNADRILNKITAQNCSFAIQSCTKDQILITVNHRVNFLFSKFNYPIIKAYKFESYIWLPSLIDLAADKAFHLNSNSPWKDYVDLYFILKDFYSPEQIVARVQDMFMPSYTLEFFFANLKVVEKMETVPSIQYIDRQVNPSMICDYLELLNQ